MDADSTETFVVLSSFMGTVIGAVGFFAALVRSDDVLALLACLGTALCAWSWAHHVRFPGHMPVE